MLINHYSNQIDYLLFKLSQATYQTIISTIRTTTARATTTMTIPTTAESTATKISSTLLPSSPSQPTNQSLTQSLSGKRKGWFASYKYSQPISSFTPSHPRSCHNCSEYQILLFSRSWEFGVCFGSANFQLMNVINAFD